MFRRLQKLMLCTSSDSTLKLIDAIGTKHDSNVIEWRDHLHERLEKDVPEVSYGAGHRFHISHNQTTQFIFSHRVIS